jgi:hypothetical protein
MQLKLQVVIRKIKKIKTIKILQMLKILKVIKTGYASANILLLCFAVIEMVELLVMRALLLILWYGWPERS